MSDDIKELAKRLREIVAAFPENQLDLDRAADALEALTAERDRLKSALVRLRDCDWVITLPDRMDGVREIARKALEDKE